MNKPITSKKFASDLWGVVQMAIEEVAKELDQFAGAFGRDTVQSFAAFVRNMKK